MHDFRCLVATAKTTSEFIASIVIMTCVTVMHTRHMCWATAVLRQGLLSFLENVITSVTTVDMKSLIEQEWWGTWVGNLNLH